MKGKRLGTLVLGCTLAFTVLLSGCGGNTNKQAGTQGASGTQGAAGSTSALSAAAKNVNKTGEKIVNETITLKIAMRKPALDKAEMASKEYTKALEKKTNVKVDWIEIPETNLAEKTNIMLAGGDLPDAFVYTLSEVQMANNYKNKVFVPLNKLIDEWAPNVKKGLDEHPDVKKYLTMDDGNIYSTPAGELAPWLLYRSNIFINKDWTTKLGLKMPETTEEYYQLLKAFKEKDPNGNGKNDEIPLSLANENSQINNILTFAGSFGIPMNYGYNKPVEYITIKDKKAVFAPATDNFKEFLTYFSKLAKEGLLDKESFSQSLDQFRAKGKNAGTPILGSFSQFLEDENVGDDRISMYAPIKPLKGPKGDQIAYKERLAPQMGCVITKANKNPEATMRWVDYMNTDVFTKIAIQTGDESLGVWSKVNGKYLINSEKAPQGVSFAEWWATAAWMRAPIVLYPDEVKNYRQIDPRPARKLEFCDLVEPYANKDDLARIILPLDLQNQIMVIQPDLKKLVDNFIAQSVLQGIDDNSWKAFQSNLEKAKYKEYEALYQKVYDLGAK